jgi:hypothetical protein
MTLTQREYDVSQLEAELKIQKLFDEWRKAFLGNRLLLNTPFQQDGELVLPDMEEEVNVGNRPI